MPHSIDPSFRRGGRLDVEIEIGVPTAIARRDILRKILEGMKDHENEFQSLAESDIDRISDAAHGYVGADLQSLCLHAQSIIIANRSIGDANSLSSKKGIIM